MFFAIDTDSDDQNVQQKATKEENTQVHYEARVRRSNMRRVQIRIEVEARILAHSANTHYKNWSKRIKEREKEDHADCNKDQVPETGLINKTANKKEEWTDPTQKTRNVYKMIHKGIRNMSD